MLRAVFYARVSTEEEEQLNAIEKQIEENIDIIKSKNWKLVDQYIDRGISGTQTKKRNDYNRLLSDILTDKFDVIVVKDQSRLQRNTLDWYIFLNAVLQNDKKIFFYLENRFFTPDDKFLYGIKAMMAEEYSRDLSKKSRNAVKRRQMSGKTIITNRTWGYTNTAGVIGIDENEAPIVETIFQLFAQGYGGRIVARMLRDMGVRNRNGKTLSENTIREIVKNPLFMGTAIMNKEQFDFEAKKYIKNPESEWVYAEDAVPAIVGEELWNKANEKLNKRKNVDRTKGVNTGRYQGCNVLSSKIICGICGSLYWRNKRSTAVYWYCSEGSRSGRVRENTGSKCVSLNLKEDELLDVINRIGDRLWNEEQQEVVINKVLHKIVDMLLSNNGKKNIDFDAKIQTMEKRKSKLVDLFLDGSIAKEIYQSKLDEISCDLKTLEEEKSNVVAAQKNEEEIMSRVMSVKKIIEEGKERKINSAVLIAHLEEIRVFENRLDFHFDFLNELKTWASECRKEGRNTIYDDPICLGRELP